MRYSIVGATAAQIAAAGGTNIKETRVAIYADLTPEQAGRLVAAGCVVNKVTDIKAATLPPVPVAAQPIYSIAELSYASGIEEIRKMTTPPMHGEGFNCAIIGTGIRETHRLIGGVVVWSRNYTSDPMSDGFDHDTGVASIIHTLVPRCSLLNLKVLNNKGEGTEENFVLAMDDLITMHDNEDLHAPHVISASLGAPDTGDPSNPMRAICREAVGRGIIVICAGGNSGPAPETILSPACERDVVAVGSCSFQPFAISSFSSRGPTKEGLVKPDIVFFGEDIIMASSASDDATKANSGTSFSTPFISGAGILFKNAQQVFSSLLVTIPPEYLQAYQKMYQQAFTLLPSISEPSSLIEDFFPVICVKPQGSVVEKDNDYGSGLLFGPVIMQKLGLVPSVSWLSSAVPIILMMMVVPVFGRLAGGKA